VKSTVWPVLTALDNVNVIVVPEMAIPVIDLLELLTRTAKDVASTPVPSILSSKFRVSCVGEDVLTLPPVNPGA
jgi:hypothetical protein